MNSFNKIALTIAAALVGTMLVAPSANAVATIAVSVNGVANTTSTVLATPATVTVPSDNTVDAPDAVKYTLTGIDTGTVVSVVVTNAFIITDLHTTLSPVNASSGSTSYSVATGTGNTATFFVYTKTTAVGTVTITNAGTTSTFYVKGTAGPAYNIAPVVSTNANTSSIVQYSTTVTDVFGNVPAATTPVVTAIGATISTPSAASDITLGISKVSITYPATAGTAALGFSITATDVVGLPAAVKSVVKIITVTDLATTVASLTTELATEKSNSATALAAAKVLSDKALADAKTASDKALADAKALSDKALADAKIASDAVLAAAKASADKALADATALAVSEKAKSDFALATYKAKYNALVNRWNKAHPKSKLSLLP